MEIAARRTGRRQLFACFGIISGQFVRLITIETDGRRTRMRSIVEGVAARRTSTAIYPVTNEGASFIDRRYGDVPLQKRRQRKHQQAIR